MSGFELDFIEWLRGQDLSEFRIQNSEWSNPIRIGDDMAMLETPDGRFLMSSDMLLDGVHFDTKTHAFADVGRKAVACCLSDCAAMAVRPVAITVSMALPTQASLDHAKQLMSGMKAIADVFETPIVGGDTTRWAHPLAIDVAIFAQPYDGIDPVTRSAAKPGDTLYVTGPLGGSQWGRHLTFTPRVGEARRLAEKLRLRLHTMIDISDGLSLDLWRVCQASGVGATLTRTDLDAVISEDARRAADADGRSALDHALSDGEDFELLMAVEGDVTGVSVPLHRIGEVTDRGMLLQETDGRCVALDPRGYVH